LPLIIGLAVEEHRVTPILTDDVLDIITHSPKQTFQIGQRLGSLLRSGDVVCLQGELGSGKTCMTQGIGAGLHVAGVIHSPTFVFINEHAPVDSGPYLYHVDLYRVGDFIEALALGLEDYLYGDGVTVVEWAERAADVMPPERLWITLTYLDYTKRRLLFKASGEHYRQVVLTLSEELSGSKKPGPQTSGE
jgi:tRNA threonylcarbamoyladenosine biosynthesis protein TsaE